MCVSLRVYRISQRTPTVTSGVGATEIFTLLRAAGYHVFLRGAGMGAAVPWRLVTAAQDATACPAGLCDFAAHLVGREAECGARASLLVN